MVSIDIIIKKLPRKENTKLVKPIKKTKFTSTKDIENENNILIKNIIKIISYVKNNTKQNY